jgi:UDP-N-acetylmuramate--alanine ligase
MAHRTHFIGIGGAGMSSLARILKEAGHDVSGSDHRPGEAYRDLERRGIQVYPRHDARWIQGKETVVYSSAISGNNRELCAAVKAGIPIMHRAECLAQVMEGRMNVVISGMHGKTTTTGLAAFLCTRSALEPGYLVGADHPSLDGGASLGKGSVFIAEADESDGSFLRYSPQYAVVTNIDREHLDYYGTHQNILSHFRRFFETTIFSGGQLIVCQEDSSIRKLLDRSWRRSCIRYGFAATCDVRASRIKLFPFSSRFECATPEGSIGEITLALPGRHNILNSLAAISIGWTLGCNVNSMKRALADFQGARRRFELKAHTQDFLVVDDYAHHPTEIDAVLAGCRPHKRRMVGIFQPHRYSRTQYMAQGFGRSLSGLDELILMDIYAADEKPIKGVGVNAIYRSAKRQGMKHVHVVKNKVELFSHLKKIVRPKDLVLTLGAGDIGELSDEVAQTVAI